MATDWGRSTVLDLRAELKKRGLPQTGKKADLVERLTQADNDGATQVEEQPAQLDERTQTPPKDEGTQSPPNNDTSAEPTVTQQSEEALLVSQSPKQTEAVNLASQPTPPNESATTDQPDQPPTVASETQAPVPDAAPAIEEVEEEKPAEPSVPAPVAEVSQDVNSRKRRSRSPPPDEEVSRKRARPSDDGPGETSDPDAMHLDVTPGKDVSYAIIEPKVAPTELEPESHEAQFVDNGHPEPRDSNMAPEYRNSDKMRPASLVHDTRMSPEYPEEQDDRQTSPSEHPATSAIYIKNFMRPLRENMLMEYLAELAVPRGRTPDPDAVVDFYLDQIRTHAFVQFRSISAASRVRVALHQQVWPNERERKELWVDFIPPEKVKEWSEREKSEGGRGSRWEVRYDFDDDGSVTARLVNVDAEPPRRPSRVQQPPPPAPPSATVPTGPSRPFASVEGAPLGPRGRGTAGYRQDTFPAVGGEMKYTTTRPILAYKPVATDLAERRLENMRSYFTKDRHRDMGREDEINRYTFEGQDGFVDRGKENFVGIRPPHREREVQARRAMERDGTYRAPPPSYAPPPRGGDRYFGGGRDEPRGEPRSRLNGAPMPTFESSRGGFGGGRGGRRGWRR